MELPEALARLIWTFLQWRILLSTAVGVGMASLMVRVFPSFFDQGAFFVGLTGFVIGIGWNYLASEKRWNAREAKKAVAQARRGRH